MDMEKLSSPPAARIINPIQEHSDEIGYMDVDYYKIMNKIQLIK